MKEWQKLIELPPVTGAPKQLRSAETLEREREIGREGERDRERPTGIQDDHGDEKLMTLGSEAEDGSATRPTA